MTHTGGKPRINAFLRLLIATMAGAFLFAACGDENSKDSDVAADTGTDVTDTTIDPDMMPSDMPMDETMVTCSMGDNRCIGEDRRAVCQPDGAVKLESCPDNELCWAGECGAVVCTPSEVETCAENGMYNGCNPIGTGMGVWSCPAGQTCLNDACVEQVCMEGDKRCDDDGDTVLVCNDTGTGYIPSGACTDTDNKRVCDDGECKPICDVAIKTASYVGCEYWAVDLDNHIDAHSQPFAVVVSNSDSELDAIVKVYRKDGFATDMPIAEQVVPPDELAIFELPTGCYTNGSACPEAFEVNNTSQVPAAYRIEADVPITAYQFNPLDNVDVFSNDASLLLPKTSLGRRYRVMSRKQATFQFNFRGWMSVVATEEEATEVTITVTSDTLAGATPDGTPIPAMNMGDTRTFTLQQFDVLTLMTDQMDGDLTGSEVTADNLVAVFGGTEASSIPQTFPDPANPGQRTPYTCCGDHLEQQLYPVNTWGTRYMAAKSFPRNGERDFWRVLIRQDNTTVTTFPSQTEFPITLDAGAYFDLVSTEDFSITANKPILVGQFLASEEDPIDPIRGGPGLDSAGTGDPAFILGVPVEQYRRSYTFLAPNQYAFDYITVVAPTGSGVNLDGVPIDPTEFIPFADGTFSVAKLLINDGVHRIAAEEPVGLFVYGFDEYVSYGYPAGLDLEDLFQ